MYGPYLKQSQPAVYNFVRSVNSLPLIVSLYSCCDKQEVRCRASSNLSRLCYDCQRWATAFCKQDSVFAIVYIAIITTLVAHALFFALPLKHMRTFNFQKIFKRAFKIYGIWPQAQSVGLIHTHLRNAVPLVWGSLRLAPIIGETIFSLLALMKAW